MSKASDRKYSKMFRSAAKCDMRPVAWLVPNYIPRRNITLFHGPGETCKSLMALHHAAKISRGQRLEFDASGEPPTEGCVLILAQEDSVEDTIKPRLALAGADMSKIHFRATGRDIRLPEDIGALRWLIHQKHVVLVIIDTLDDFATTSTRNNQSVRKVLNGLGNLAEEEDIAIIVICHWTKQRNNKGSLRNKIAGSFGILSPGPVRLRIRPRPRRPGHLDGFDEGQPRRPKTTVLFDVDVQPVQIDGRPVDHPRVLYCGTSPITEDDFEGAPSKVDEAVEYLKKGLPRNLRIAGRSWRSPLAAGRRCSTPRNSWQSPISGWGRARTTAASGSCPIRPSLSTAVQMGGKATTSGSRNHTGTRLHQLRDQQRGSGDHERSPMGNSMPNPVAIQACGELVAVVAAAAEQIPDVGDLTRLPVPAHAIPRGRQDRVCLPVLLRGDGPN